MSIKAKLKAIGDAVASIEKQFGQGAIFVLGDGPGGEGVPSFSTGSFTLDRALGTGGYPRGRLIEVYGPEASGKTTLTLHAIAEVQRLGGTAAFIDAEHALDPGYARALGVDVGSLLVSQPDYGEQALEIAHTLVQSEAVSLVVIDSVAALVPKAELDGEIGDHHVGLQARMMSQAMRMITGVTHRTGSTVMFINQIRQKVGVTFGSPETTTGGNALKFYASVRLDVRRIGQIKVGEEVVGNRTKVKVVKNKMAPPFRVALFDIRFGQGISREGELVDLGLESGVISKSGAWLSVGDQRLGNGRDKAMAALKEQPELARLLAERLAGVVAPPVEAGDEPAPAALDDSDADRAA
jgi:recombination protein RecA